MRALISSTRSRLGSEVDVGPAPVARAPAQWRPWVSPALSIATAFWVGLMLVSAPDPPSRVLTLAALAWIPTAIMLEAAARGTAALLGGDAWQEQLQSILRPLCVLPLAAIDRVLPVPWLPTALGIAVATAAASRLNDALPRPLPEPVRGRLLVAGACALVVPGMLLWQVTVIHDAFQYHATAVSLVLDGNFDTFEKLFLYNSHRSYNPYPEGSIRYLGVPLLQTPSVLLGHLSAFLLGAAGWGYAVNGFSLPYTFWLGLCSSTAGGAGVALTLRWVARRVGARVAFAAVGLGLWASPLPMFLFLWHGWTHTYSILGVALLLLQRDRIVASGRAGGTAWFVLGLIAGVLCMIWPVNGLILVLPAVDIMASLRATPTRAAGWSGALLLGVLVGFLPQLAGWYGATGDWAGSTYGRVGDSFLWTEPAILPLLFSWSQHGCFTWHPVYVPAFLGVLLTRNRRLALALGVWVLAQIYVVSCWSVWWTGIGFGNRFFLNLFPVAALGLAELLGVAWQRRGRFTRAWRVAVASAALLLVVANLSLLSAYRSDVIPMGIKGPNYVQDAPPSALELFRRLTVDAPPTLAQLTRDFWVNQAFVMSRLRTAVTGDSGAWVSVTLVSFFVLAAWALVTWLALRHDPVMHDATVRAAVNGVVLLLCVSAWLALALRPSPAYVPFLRLDAGETILRPGQKATFVPQGYLEPTREIDLISFLTYAVYVPQGRPVAVLRAYTEDGESIEHFLQAGVHTAETSAYRPEVAAITQHRRELTTPVHEWITRAYSRALYPAHAFLARFPMPQPARIEYIEVEMLYGGGDLVLRDVFLRG